MTQTVTIPTDAAGLEETLADDARLKAILEGGGLGEFVRNYADAHRRANPDVTEQVRDAATAALKAFLDEHGIEIAKGANGKPPVNLGPGTGQPVPEKNWQPFATPLNGLFGGVGEFMSAIYHRNRPSAEVRAKLDTIKALQEKVPAEGGYLVPEEFRANLERLSLTASVVRSRARVIPMSSPSLSFPKVDETSRTSSVYGGVVVYRTEEAGLLVESGPAFSRVRLEATKQTAFANVTNELVADWPAFGTFIGEVMPEAMAFYEDKDFLNGTGVGEPMGSLNVGNPAIIVVAKEGGQAAGTILWLNVLKMYARMLPSSLSRAVWVVSPDTFPQLATMSLSVGTGGAAVWMPDAHGTPTLTLLGRPVIIDDKVPGSLTQQGDISFVDFGMYLIGDRQLMTADSSPHYRFGNDQTSYRIIARNDGRPWLDTAITPANNSATLSAFVQLQAR